MSDHPSGVHHVAIMAGDIKKHIAFFSEVVGCPLVGLFDMHGVEGGLHAFLKMSDGCYFSIVQLPGVDQIPIEIGRTHAGRGELPSAPGTMQHLAFGVASLSELMAMRDRIRSHGVNAIGPINHGFCQSIYFAGPDHMTLEVAASMSPIDPSFWIDPKTVEKAGISPAEAARYRAPAPFEGLSPAPQPPFDASQPHLTYPREIYLKMIAAPDEAIAAAASYPKPPVSAASAA